MRTKAVDGAWLAVLLAIGLTIVAQVELWLIWMPDPDEATGAVPLSIRAVAALGAAPLTLSLGLGWRLPLASVALAIPAVALAPAGPFESSVALAAAIILAAFRAAVAAAGSRDLAFGALGLVGVAATTAFTHPSSIGDPGDLGLLMLLLAGPWVAGAALRLRLEREGQLESAAARAEATRRTAAATAVASERARIARELHDVVAHAISVIVLQARGGRRAIGRDPEAAAQSLEVIEATASRALAEMRRLVDVLRPSDEAGGLAPPPGLAQLDALVAGVREAGLVVDVRVEGQPVELAPGIDLAAYRVVQEALTNTLRHAAGAAAQVVLRYQPAALEVEVIDDGASRPSSRIDENRGPSGHGMVGMRERAALYGGSVEAGPRPGGGFGVVARLPLAIDAG